MRSRDQLMEQWDAIRAKIASGHASDGPRLWFEGVLDDYDSALAEAERRADRPEEIPRKGFSIEKIGGKDECTHPGVVAFQNPQGGYSGRCPKCGETFHHVPIGWRGSFLIPSR